MSQRKILVMAGIVGALMFALLYTTLSQVVASRVAEEKVVEVVEAPKKKIVVAATDILSHTIIMENMITLAEVPESMELTDAVTKTEDIIGKPARVDILKGDIITGRKFYKDIGHAGFIGLIPPDCRAVSIGISDITSVSGFVNAGDFVDVMLVSDSGNGITSEVILQNVMLLAIGRDANKFDESILKDVAGSVAEGVTSSINSLNKSGGDKNSSTATLALHMDEIMKLTTAARRGTIYLVLRPFRPTEEFVENTYYVDNSAPSKQDNAFDPLKGMQAFQQPESSVPDSTNTTPPTPAFQPPASPVLGPIQNPDSQVAYGPVSKPIEIIQGDQVVNKQKP